MPWRGNRGMSNTQELVFMRSLYLHSLIITKKPPKNKSKNKNYQTKISNLNTRLEFKVDELKFAKLKLR